MYSQHHYPLSPSLPIQNLGDFLDMYYAACSVLKTEADFYDLMYAYLLRASIDSVVVAEIFFDPQTHTERGVSFDTVINGLHRAIVDGHLKLGIKASLIMCFLRDKSEESAIEILNMATPHLDKIVAVGLDSAEVDNPPSKFERVYKMAAGLGLKLVAHAGEEAGPAYIKEALDVLHVRRIDHGVRCLEDDQLVQRLVDDAVPLITCPLSNEKLKVDARFFGGKNMTKELLDRGLKVTINSDDPAYFGGYITENFQKTASKVGLTEKEVCQLCRNAIEATFLHENEKQYYLAKIDCFNVAMGYAAPPKSITFFGSRRPIPGSEEYDACARAAREFASRGYQVVNGGYGGLMEASSRGAAEARGRDGVDDVRIRGVLSPRVFSGRHSHGNEFLTDIMHARSLCGRLEGLLDSSEYFYVSGGTIGTITELLVVWHAATLRPLYGGKCQKIFLLRSFWEKVLEGLVSSTGVYPEDRGLLMMVEDEKELVQLVEEDYAKRLASATL